LWSLQFWPRFGWVFALAYAVSAALRLARFNASIDVEEQPHKSAGFLTGVPAPVGAGLMLFPLYLWMASDRQWGWLQDWRLVAPWAGLCAFLMVSNLATFSWTSLRLRQRVRLWVILLVALVGGALFSAPWQTLSVVAVLYVLMIPFSILSYARLDGSALLRLRRAHRHHRTRTRTDAGAGGPGAARRAYRHLAAKSSKDILPIFPHGEMDHRGGSNK
jgi:CDP-diacylglycerol--serine O-phosphatidyltransferase